ncbi:glutathione S-transferase Ure2-like protein [Xylona heveae TC161]|uniref:Glutathione S-transferase Ure2-like protein n=1 Tax=Xylona heveae (strain CBS 132557 / TC161) TaxID=1328760 RepID=A0A165HGU9_XYLHT|nr:glutathione S-transferase Ure2-like protein [Xylona heveae TC161]KZF23494.1 glutathione S-transferase Ure2-like protein [Xylona heveae TC161]
MTLQTITLYSHRTGPNPWKVVMILEELSLSYKNHFFEDLADLKKPAYEKINPNGRVPAIEDPNTGITLWESGAIIEYLIDTYDKDNKLSFTSFPEKYLTKQWLYFQVSGQGPYYGQGGWFSNFHPEKLPSAIERYQNEIQRVLGVLDHALEGKQYLVGEKCTYADISFVSWNSLLPWLLTGVEVDIAKKFPNYHAWNERVTNRPAVQKTIEVKKVAMAEGKK